MQSDIARLRQILTNVIGNAIKFTSNGFIEVDYGIVDGFVTFTVSDTGIGISEEQMEKLFKPFSQGDSSVRKTYGGTGLGLLISQRLARLLGGDVGLLESHVGRGSTFYIKIPYLPGVPSANDKPISELSERSGDAQLVLTGKKILVCEDSIDNQVLAKAYLLPTGATVDFAANGSEGLEKFKEKQYDLVLMDMQMPVIDGFKATEMLRSMGTTVPIIALTGYAMRQDKDRCLSVGCNDFLAKPFNKADFYRCISIYLSHESTIEKQAVK